VRLRRGRKGLVIATHGSRRDQLGQPHVRELGGAVGAEQHVRRLDVAVDDRLRSARRRLGSTTKSDKRNSQSVRVKPAGKAAAVPLPDDVTHCA
jgi:hypothetical protein